MKIYLAGGLNSGWQDEVKKQCHGVQFFDPRLDSPQTHAYKFTQGDVKGLNESDIVFAYYELSNPSGLGLAFEIGYALAQGKQIIYVDEHPCINSLLSACAYRVFSNFDEAIIFLNKWVGI
jgi:nucleoside 2-deoxyribosyltransferase